MFAIRCAPCCLPRACAPSPNQGRVGLPAHRAAATPTSAETVPSAAASIPANSFSSKTLAATIYPAALDSAVPCADSRPGLMPAAAATAAWHASTVAAPAPASCPAQHVITPAADCQLPWLGMGVQRGGEA